MILSKEYVGEHKLLLTFVPCPSCDETHQLTVDYSAFEDYKDGLKGLQEAFPELTPAERELFLTAIDGACYKKMVDQGEY